MSSGLYIKQKRDFHASTWLFGLIVATLVGICAWFGYQWFVTGEEPPVIPLPASALADPSIDETPVTLKMVQDHKVPASHPRYISIPSLNVVNARVQSVGLTENNLLDTPKNISDAAWYRKSATPGQGYGAVVIDGHNGGISRDGVFANLDKLQRGDKVTIERGDGKKITYTVLENKTESLESANTTGMKRLMTPYDTSKEGLGLITCAGKWIPRDKIFDQRIIIRAVAE